MMFIGEMQIFYCSCLPVLFLICIEVISLLVKMINLSFTFPWFSSTSKRIFQLRHFKLFKLLIQNSCHDVFCSHWSCKAQMRRAFWVLKNGLNLIFDDWNENSVLKVSKFSLFGTANQLYVLFSINFLRTSNDYTHKLHHTSKNLVQLPMSILIPNWNYPISPQTT